MDVRSNSLQAPKEAVPGLAAWLAELRRPGRTNLGSVALKDPNALGWRATCQLRSSGRRSRVQ